MTQIQSIDRAIQILYAFSTEDRLIGVSELSERLGLNQSTVHHLASSLKKWGLLEQDAASRKYRLGLRLIELGGTMLQSRSLARIIQPYLYHVAETVKESTYLGVLVGRDLLNIDQVSGPHLIQYSGWQGRRTAFYMSSAGKVLAAYLPPDELDKLINAGPLEAFTAKTRTDPDDLRRHLDEIRAQGYAMSIGELDENVNAIAVPIKRPGNDMTRVIAAIGIAGPAYRFTPEACLAAAGFLRSVGQEVSSKVATDDFNTPGPY
jgi:DNA-binding IclR family transcriptional regulator